MRPFGLLSCILWWLLGIIPSPVVQKAKEDRVQITVDSSYPMIKPGRNSFVWEQSSNPTIFLFLDPDVTADKFENSVAHEMHHIGLGSLGPVAPTCESTSLDQRIRPITSGAWSRR